MSNLNIAIGFAVISNSIQKIHYMIVIQTDTRTGSVSAVNRIFLHQGFYFVDHLAIQVVYLIAISSGIKTALIPIKNNSPVKLFYFSCVGTSTFPYKIYASGIFNSCKL